MICFAPRLSYEHLSLQFTPLQTLLTKAHLIFHIIALRVRILKVNTAYVNDNFSVPMSFSLLIVGPTLSNTIKMATGI